MKMMTKERKSLIRKVDKALKAKNYSLVLNKQELQALEILLME